MNYIKTKPKRIHGLKFRYLSHSHVLTDGESVTPEKYIYGKVRKTKTVRYKIFDGEIYYEEIVKFIKYKRYSWINAEFVEFYV